MQKIILASGSKNRQTLLKTLNIPFKVVISNFDESKVKETNPILRAQKIALGKAKAVLKNHQGIIIACDTFTVCQGKTLEKPVDLTEAKKMLKQLSGNKAVSYTGFYFSNKAKNIKFLKTAVTKLVFRKIYEKEIGAYVKKFPVTTRAGAYAINEQLYVAGLVKNISGSLTGVHGLPTEFLIPLLKKSGYQPKPV